MSGHFGTLCMKGFKLFVATEKSEVREQNFAWFFYYFSFEVNYDVLKSKRPCILLDKNINFNKKRNRKLKIPHSYKETNLVFKLIEESQIKNKTVICNKLELKKEKRGQL